MESTTASTTVESAAPTATMAPTAAMATAATPARHGQARRQHDD
jgi:hypothetical protein